MLLELRVQNFAIIDQVQIPFELGLNILSGETGAGKSVLLRSLALLMGEKSAAEDVRTGRDQAVIEGSFDLAGRPDIGKHLHEMGIEVEDDHLIVRRIIASGGKGRIYLNGALSNLQDLREVISPLITVTGQNAPLIEMTGQHDNRHLQSKSYHLDILDRFAGSFQLRLGFSEKFARLRSVEENISRLQNEARDREQRLDFLKYQRDEIRALGLHPGEEEQLSQRMNRLKNAAKLQAFAAESIDSLQDADDSAFARVHQVLARALEMSTFDETLPRKLEGLNQTKVLIEDTVYELRSYLDELDDNPVELDGLEDKFSQLKKLQKKYGSTVEEMLLLLQNIEQEISELERSDETLADLEKERLGLEKELLVLAKDLHTRRTNAAKLLAKEVNEELLDLNMKGVTFLVSVAQLEALTSTGFSDTEFRIQASKKDEPRSLAKFASGGELSRILLSLKSVVGQSELPRTYLFDEVDAGVSGPTAEKVGRKLKSISKGRQVICVTHLAQVAAYADTHFLIEKNPDNKKGVSMRVDALKKDERVQEIARLISGEKITKTSLEHAKQLLADV